MCNGEFCVRSSFEEKTKSSSPRDTVKKQKKIHSQNSLPQLHGFNKISEIEWTLIYCYYWKKNGGGTAGLSNHSVYT